jgi:hypothetical protein
MTLPEDVAPDGAGKSFLAWGYKYFAPMALPVTRSMSQRVGHGVI